MNLFTIKQLLGSTATYRRTSMNSEFTIFKHLYIRVIHVNRFEVATNIPSQPVLYAVPHKTRYNTIYYVYGIIYIIIPINTNTIAYS